MSTREVIAIEDSNKTGLAIYVHFDMYLDGGGICLTQHYTSQDRIEKLLALGGLSALGDWLSEDDPERKHRTPVSLITVITEPPMPPDEWESADKLLEQAHHMLWAEYVYLFRNGEWVFNTPCHPQDWRSVKQTLLEGQ